MPATARARRMTTATAEAEADGVGPDRCYAATSTRLGSRASTIRYAPYGAFEQFSRIDWLTGNSGCHLARLMEELAQP